MLFLRLPKKHSASFLKMESIITIVCCSLRARRPPPCISAWSEEVLERLVAQGAIPEDEIQYYKYSFADSPYYAFGDEEYFQQVKQLFEERDPLMDYNNEEQWEKEYNFRLAAIVYAMKKLDEAGIFALNQPRAQVYINVELMPPDDTDIQRACPSTT